MTSTTKTKTEPTASMADQLRSAIAKSGRSFYELNEAGGIPCRSKVLAGERPAARIGLQARRRAGVAGRRPAARKPARSFRAS